MATSHPTLRLTSTTRHPDAPDSWGPAGRSALNRLARPTILGPALLAAYAVIAEEVVADRRVRLDLAVERLVHGWTDPALTTALDAVTRLGSTPIAVLIYVAMVVWLAAQRRFWTAATIAAAAGSGHLLVHILKQMAGRTRPELFPRSSTSTGTASPAATRSPRPSPSGCSRPLSPRGLRDGRRSSRGSARPSSSPPSG